MLRRIRIKCGESGMSSTCTIDGIDPGDELRSEVINANVSAVSAIPEVREKLVNLQRSYLDRTSIVMEGRDIGTVVLPNADLKVWLYAEPAVRAARRVAEDQAARRASAMTIDDMAADLARRDAADSSRADSPTRQADDAVAVDATELTLAEVIDAVISLITARELSVNGALKEQS